MVKIFKDAIVLEILGVASLVVTDAVEAAATMSIESSATIIIALVDVVVNATTNELPVQIIIVAEIVIIMRDLLELRLPPGLFNFAKSSTKNYAAATIDLRWKQ